MPGSGRSGMIDGFRTVQAVRKRSERGVPPKPQKNERARSVQESELRSDSVKKGSPVSIGKTALPTRHDLVCYSCRYKFVVNGRLDKVFCPKCREQLETGDHTVDGAWDKDVLTVGKVYIKPGGRVAGCRIVATDIVIAGDCSEADLCPTRQLELETGAVVAPGNLNNSRIVIRAGGEIALDVPLRCQELEVYGSLHANASPSGLVVIHPGGMFRGSLTCEHLVVCDGGGLSADLRIGVSLAGDKAEVPQDRPKDGRDDPAKADSPDTAGGGSRVVVGGAVKHTSQVRAVRVE